MITNCDYLPSNLTELPASGVTMQIISWPCAFFLLLGCVAAFILNDGPTSSSSHLSEHSESPLRIGSMNVQVFGRTKIHLPVVRHWLPKILARYDVVLIQEIRDITGTAFDDLWHLVNEELRTQHVNDIYDKVVSGRLGRTTSKEQYGFLFRKSKLQVSDTYQYPDPGDIFEREPFTVRFRAPHAAVGDFAISAIHTSPNHAKDEIGNLTKVYDAIRQHWHIEVRVTAVSKFN
ncbi:hypothetical protein ACJMK2_022435 [Sinanodonta woodiana]|uniref:Uncharacterized protein n=1 Tax=Sinanodonta woodiana TaxID=1069815 RepID=A0ABD3TLR1_SINWO